MSLKKAHKCLCGETGIRLNGHSNELGACHCTSCRTWSGGPFLTVKIDQGVTIEGETNVALFQSSDWAERAFCKLCGTHLFYRVKANGEAYVPAGLVESDSALVFDHQIFIDQKPDYYNFAEQTENLTSEQVFAMFAAEY